ncbi:MAG: hypothetical protein CMJ98_08960 [Planctomycetes bacterium]|jgi:hypothetical protein|nr:hypothetical protein [Planctomycetota bacterium]
MEPFKLGDVPPLTDNLPFPLGTTTLYITTETPHDIGNVLVNELSLLAKIEKINCRKFTIVASAGDEVSTPGMGCKLKARLYALGGDAYAIEFQRRGGDCVMYNALFRQIKDVFAIVLECVSLEGSGFLRSGGQLVPPAPVLGPSRSPETGPPSLELPESAFDTMAAASDVFASWSLDVVRGFECAHEELWTRVRRDRADAAELKEHLRKIPEPIVTMYSLKVQPCRRGRTPMNAEVLCEQIDLMIAEAVAFWETQV